MVCCTRPTGAVCANSSKSTAALAGAVPASTNASTVHIANIGIRAPFSDPEYHIVGHTHEKVDDQPAFRDGKLAENQLQKNGRVRRKSPRPPYFIANILISQAKKILNQN
jgi:hypothetical protein